MSDGEREAEAAEGSASSRRGEAAVSPPRWSRGASPPAGQALPCSWGTRCPRCLCQQAAGRAVLLPVLDLARPARGSRGSGLRPLCRELSGAITTPQCCRDTPTPWQEHGARQHPFHQHLGATSLLQCGVTGGWGLPYRVQYHSLRQREHRLAASTPHTRHRGLSGARASSRSRLYVCAHLQWGQRGQGASRELWRCQSLLTGTTGHTGHGAGPHLRAWSFSSSSVGLKACFTWCLAMASHLPAFFLRRWSQMTGTWRER